MPAASSIILGGLAAGAVAGAVGNAASAGDRQAAIQQNQAAVQKWLDLHVPDPAEQKIVLQNYVQQGQLAPQLETALKQDASNYEKIQTDPSYKQAQLKALGQLSDIGSSGGMTLMDKANYQKGLNDINSDAAGRTGAIMNNFAARGVGGSGAELTAQLSGAQNATNRVADVQLNTLASARQRALDAIMKSGDLAGNMQQNEFGQQAQVAAAKDAINRFNTTNMTSANTRNTDRSNLAQEYNLNQAQRISDLNTGNKNQEEVYNKNLIQQQYQNNLAKTAGATGQYNNLANAYNKNAQSTSDMWGGIGSAATKGATTYAMYGAGGKTQPSTTPSSTNDIYGADYDPYGKDEEQRYA